ncbi:MAG: hypothetical protein ACKO2N_01725, partial [Tabrizicola sp.]
MRPRWKISSSVRPSTAICIAATLVLVVATSASTQPVSDRSDLDLARNMMVSNPTGALALAEGFLAKTPSGPANRPSALEATWLKAQALSRLGRNGEALSIVNPAIDEASQDPKETRILAELTFTRASINRLLGRLTGAAKDTQESIRLFQETSDRNGQFKSFILIASIHANAGDFS